MAQLSSPGVSVTVVDESFYTPAAPGTVPLIVVASQANKMNAAGTGTAPGTLAANAGKVYLLTSQADLGATFGVPYFQTDAENNPVHAGEVNEYGLQAAYSFLGVSNRAYVVRADVDLAQLKGSAIIPAGLPENGTYWWDTATTNFGVFQWNSAVATVTGGQTFTNQTVAVITSTANLSNINDATSAPAASFGAVGSYAITATTTLNSLWFKKYLTNTAAGTWVKVGSSAWAASWPVVTGAATTGYGAGHTTIKINGTNVTNLGTDQAGMATAINSAAISGITAAAINGILNIYSTGVAVLIAAGDTNSALTVSGLTAGSYNAPALTIAPHFQVPNYGTYGNNNPTGSVWIKTTPVNLGANWDIEKYNANSGKWIRQTVSALYPNNHTAMAALDPKGGGINIPVGTVYVKYNDDEGGTPEADFKIYQRTATGALSITSTAITNSTFTSGSNTFQFQVSTTNGTLTSLVTATFSATGATTDAGLVAAAISTAAVGTNLSATVNSDNTITISHNGGGDIRFVDGTNTPLSKLFNVSTTANFDVAPTGTGYIATAWSAVDSTGTTALVTPSATAPTTTPADGTLWYDSTTSDVDIMINDGTHWRGFLTTGGKAVNQITGPVTDASGPIISATQPTAQTNGSPLANGDIWVDVSDLEMYPQIYKYNYLTKAWVLLDATDQTTQNGIVFADARWSDESNNTSTVKKGADAPDSIASLLSSDFVDVDAPDPALYPRGILLFNLRRSSFNVKKYVKDHVAIGAYNTRMPGSPIQTYYYPDRWVSDAANNYKGVGQFGRKAQRAVVIQALNALIESNQQIRDEDSRIFDIMSCPGYLETLPALDSLNADRGLLSFIVADAPARLTPDATTLNNWGKNVNKATGDGEDGLISTSAYSAVYYPWGYTTDLHGNNVVVPPSHIMLRTIALSDNVSYPWFAPAGVRRGGVTNASSVGYVDGQSGEFVPVALNNGQRDTLAGVHVNPITYIGGQGLICYGQYTRQLVASSLDRINVARLVIYLRYQLNAIAKPFIFEPNDTITRNEIKNQIEKMLLELVGQRALYDYIVVCDKSNNTPARIDRNELHVDIAIEPVKAVEFIYIPMHLENTGAIAGLGA